MKAVTDLMMGGGGTSKSAPNHVNAPGPKKKWQNYCRRGNKVTINTTSWSTQPSSVTAKVPAQCSRRSSGCTHLVAQGQVLAVFVGQTLGLEVVFGELQRSLTALGQQSPMRQEGLLLPRRYVDGLVNTALTQGGRESELSYNSKLLRKLMEEPKKSPLPLQYVHKMMRMKI